MQAEKSLNFSQAELHYTSVHGQFGPTPFSHQQQLHYASTAWVPTGILKLLIAIGRLARGTLFARVTGACRAVAPAWPERLAIPLPGVLTLLTLSTCDACASMLGDADAAAVVRTDAPLSA